MNKRVLIEFSLVEESMKKSNKEIVDEIYDAFSKDTICIPWCREIKKVMITEA